MKVKYHKSFLIKQKNPKSIGLKLFPLLMHGEVTVMEYGFSIETGPMIKISHI